MAMVAGRPFLTYLLDQLVESGIQRTVLCTGYMADLIRNELGDGYRDMELVYSVENSPLGTGGAIRNAAGLLSGDLLLVMNGDSYCQCNVADFVARNAASGAYAGMTLARVDDVARFGAVRTNDASFVESFMEKGGQTGPGWINAGIYLLPVDQIQTISPDRQVSLEREVFPALIAKGLYGYHSTGLFIDIGVPEEFQRSQLFFSGQTKGKP
ncbi:MAG: sugar phosphate nucleotidyltransferase, partial [Desulfuromonadaceae bacterium]|nr:sugar phosphate nucleotidyltransferase [Desulfuromonadaceae bacterium]